MTEKATPRGDGSPSGDLNEIIHGWEFDPTSETNNVRLVAAPDGSQRVQLRVRFGLLQLYADGAPETGGESILDEINRELADYRARKGSDKDFSINTFRTAQASQEIMDYYQRRVCFFLLADYRRAMRDAEHNLDLLRLLKKYSVDGRTVDGHDRYRPFVLMDRARAAAMIAMEQDDFDRAMAEIDEAVGAIEAFYREAGHEEFISKSNEIDVLRSLKADLRREYCIPMTKLEHIESLKEEQERAIAREDYEKAARIRDEIHEIEEHGRTEERGVS